jgi:hypothetical protein
MSHKDNKFSKFRIAVCLSGQPRYWNIAAKNIKKYFNFDINPTNLLETETDYFIHTWDTNTWRKPKQHHHIFENVKHNDKDKIIETFTPVLFEQEEFIAENFHRAWDPMFYSHSKSLMLKRNYELDLDFEYDLVIKARLDVVYDPNTKFPIQARYPSLTCYSSNISKFPSEFNSNCFDDVIFWGNSPTMDLVGDQYNSFILDNSKIPKSYGNQSIDRLRNRPNNTDTFYPEDLNVTTFLGPGTLLHDHMKKIEVRMEKINIAYAVVRSTAADANLDSIKDYAEVKRKYVEWYI